MVTLDEEKNISSSNYENFYDECKDNCASIKKNAQNKHKEARFGLLQTFWKGCKGSKSKQISNIFTDEVF